MNKTPYEAKQLIEAIDRYELDAEVDACVCAPAVDLGIISGVIGDTDLSLGAQNMYFEESGAFTGETSPLMLKDLAVDYVILGHSERRQIFHEDDALIQKKIQSALKHGLKPILCVGETLEERESRQAEDKVKGQLEKDLEGLRAEDFSNIVIAYEPIWAIGTGKTASAEDAEAMCSFIRKQIARLFTEEAAEAVRIQYGGSVKPENVKEIMSQKNIDGALVGGASLKAESFVDLVNYNEA